MPHGLSMPQSGFQALILCGPGIGLSTFTSVPDEYPKALVNLANRPMIWYVLDWCYRMGVTDITLITPKSSERAIKSALERNPYLTSLPSPSADVLAPANLDHTTPTAELLRLPEVQTAIRTDFLLLPCDLVCDVPGEVFLESYLTHLGGFGAVGNVSDSGLDSLRSSKIGAAEESSCRRGGLSVWYNTVNREESVKKEECDFMCTTKLDGLKPVAEFEHPSGVLRQLAWTIPMSELREECQEQKAWKVRRSLLRRYNEVKCLTKYRDSHIYLFPSWVKEFAKHNEEFESVSEDLVGTWAKCGWRKSGYQARYHAKKLFARRPRSRESPHPSEEPTVEDELDFLSLSSTQTTRHPKVETRSRQHLRLASRVQADPDDSLMLPESASDEGEEGDIPPIPPIYSYVLSATPSAALVRRVDTTALLLSIALLLAKIPSIDEAQGTASISPFAHPAKIAATTSIAPRVTISRSDSLIDSNTTVATQSVIKSSVIGSSVTIGTGARITNCLIMDGALIGDRSVLNGTIVGKKAKIGKNCTLNSCEVQDAHVLSDGTEGKGEKYLIGGLEDCVEDDEGMTQSTGGSDADEHVLS